MHCCIVESFFLSLHLGHTHPSFWVSAEVLGLEVAPNRTIGEQQPEYTRAQGPCTGTPDERSARQHPQQGLAWLGTKFQEKPAKIASKYLLSLTECAASVPQNRQKSIYYLTMVLISSLKLVYFRYWEIILCYFFYFYHTLAACGAGTEFFTSPTVTTCKPRNIYKSP